MSDSAPDLSIAYVDDGLIDLPGLKPPLTREERVDLTDYVMRDVPVYHIVMSGIRAGGRERLALIDTEPQRIQFDGLLRSTPGPIDSDAMYVAMRTQLAESAGIEQASVHSLSLLDPHSEPTDAERMGRMAAWLDANRTPADSGDNEAETPRILQS